MENPLFTHRWVVLSSHVVVVLLGGFPSILIGGDSCLFYHGG